MRDSISRKSSLLATNHNHHYGANQKMICPMAETDFGVFGGRNRLSFKFVGMTLNEIV